MPGYKYNRFVDLSDREKKHLSCGICLRIFRKAITSECGHNFCEKCLRKWIENKHKECHDCRVGFKKRRSNANDNNINLVIISRYGFTRNLVVNSMVKELKIKCKYNFNGCQELLEFGALSSHLKQCEHRICKSCETTVGISLNHNCLELLKIVRKELMNKLNQSKEVYEKSEQMIETMKSKIKDLEKDKNYFENKFNEIKRINDKNERTIDGFRSKINGFNEKSQTKQLEDFIYRFEDHLPYIYFDINCVQFGTYFSHEKRISFYKYSLSFNAVQGMHFGINYKYFEKTMYCSDPSLPVLIIKVDSESCLYIRQRLKLMSHSKGWFDVNSKDPNEWYMTIGLPPEKIFLAIELLSLRLSKCEPKLKCESIDVKKAIKLVNVVPLVECHPIKHLLYK